MTMIDANKILLSNGMNLNDYLDSAFQKIQLKQNNILIRIYRMKKVGEYTLETPFYVVGDSSNSDYMNFVNYDFPGAPELDENGYIKITDFGKTMEYFVFTNFKMHTSASTDVNRVDFMYEYSVDNGTTWTEWAATQLRMQLDSSITQYETFPSLVKIGVNNALFRIKITPHGNDITGFDMSALNLAVVIGIPIANR